jgi:thioredoxin 1
MKRKNKVKKWGPIISVAVFSVLFASIVMYTQWTSSSEGETPKSNQRALTGRVMMVDLGATECIPCKMMAPIIEELKKEYSGKADIFFIDVWKNPRQAEKYGIRTIPTQIFYDQDGREFRRHVGFLDKKSIVAILEKLGVPGDGR